MIGTGGRGTDAGDAMVRSAGNRVRAGHGGAAARADSCYVTAINRGFTAVLAAIVAVRGSTGAALAIQAFAVRSDFAGFVEDAG